MVDINNYEDIFIYLKDYFKKYLLSKPKYVLEEILENNIDYDDIQYEFGVQEACIKIDCFRIIFHQNNKIDEWKNKTIFYFIEQERAHSKKIIENNESTIKKDINYESIEFILAYTMTIVGLYYFLGINGTMDAGERYNECKQIILEEIRKKYN